MNKARVFFHPPQDAATSVADATNDLDTERVAEIADEYEQRFADVVADVREQWADWEPPQTVSDADGVGV